jgi:hypothetical protein
MGNCAPLLFAIENKYMGEKNLPNPEKFKHMYKHRPLLRCCGRQKHELPKHSVNA